MPLHNFSVGSQKGSPCAERTVNVNKFTDPSTEASFCEAKQYDEITSSRREYKVAAPKLQDLAWSQEAMEADQEREAEFRVTQREQAVRCQGQAHLPGHRRSSAGRLLQLPNSKELPRAR